jgi:methyl-accepting chemotaxis protein
MKKFIISKISTKTEIAVQSLLLIVSISLSVAFYNAERDDKEQGQKAKIEAIADGVINGANMLMLNGIISDVEQRKLFIKKMGSGDNVKSLRLIRNKLVQKQFGPGLPEEQPASSEEIQALEDGKNYFAQTGDVLHGIVSYTESKDFRGTNCLMCHEVPEGYHNGASVIDLDISADNASLRNLVIKAVIATALLQLLFWLCINYILRKFVSTPLGLMETAIIEISNNKDFTRRIKVKSADEIGQTARSFNELMESLQTAFRLLNVGIKKVADSSHTVSTYSQEVDQGSSNQSQATSVMASAVSSVTFGTSMVSAGASEAARVSTESTQYSEKGGEVIHNAAEEMIKIADSVRQTSASISNLGEQSKQISTIVNVIKDIADQTNLLALNAAIEAARAGEQGRGFAVVADEVRKLAERTAKATQEVTVMISSIQTYSQTAVEGMAVIVSQVEDGVAMAREAGDAINHMKSGSEQVSINISDIANALEDQGKTSNEIGAQLEKVAHMTEQNSNAAKQTSAAAGELEKLAEEMRTTVAVFKV